MRAAERVFRGSIMDQPSNNAMNPCERIICANPDANGLDRFLVCMKTAKKREKMGENDPGTTGPGLQHSCLRHCGMLHFAPASIASRCTVKSTTRILQLTCGTRLVQGALLPEQG